MAEFECKIYKLTIEPHPNADAIELARVGDYRSIVKKGQFKTGDLGVFIPPGSIVPEWLIKKFDLWDEEKGKGKLAGKQGNRVKEIKLRGQLSEGLIYPVSSMVLGGTEVVAIGRPIDTETLFWMTPELAEGADVTEYLGITKWEPPIPVHMAGEVDNFFGYTLSYDIENIKKYPDVFEEDEPVVITEKLHGTWCCLGYHPHADHDIVTSKGLSGRGLVFKLNDANKNNLYVKTYHQFLNVIDDMKHLLEDGTLEFPSDSPFYILGEIFGKGVQDLHYGQTTPSFRVFDIYIGQPGRGEYINPVYLDYVCELLKLPIVPVLHTGKFSHQIVEHFTSGKETVSGNDSNIREGIVITPLIERRNSEIGRVKLKSVSETYLLRKGKTTEFN